jgi:hypothetical protein
MDIALDHLIVPSKDKAAGARFLAELLDVPCEADTAAFFAPVYVNDGFTIDFGDWPEPFDVHHYCFRVTEDDFDAIRGRLEKREIPYRDSPHGPMNNQISTWNNGKNLYWFCPDGHNWEILTVSYARSQR